MSKYVVQICIIQCKREDGMKELTPCPACFLRVPWICGWFKYGIRLHLGGYRCRLDFYKPLKVKFGRIM